MWKEIDIRNALIDYYDECVNKSSSYVLNIDSAFFIFRIVLFEVAKRKDIDVSNLHTWLAPKKHHKLMKSFEEAANDIFSSYFLRAISPEQWKAIPYCEMSNISLVEYEELMKSSYEQCCSLWSFKRIAFSIKENIFVFCRNLDKSIISQCNYYLTLPHTKRHKGIYKQFFDMLSLYLFDEYNNFLTYNNQYGSTS